MSVVAPEVELALAALDAVVAVDPHHPPERLKTAGEAAALLDATERLVRLASVARVDAIAAVQRSGMFRPWGFANAHHLARHLGRLSAGESARADKIRRMIDRCDDIDAAWRAGDLSVDQAAVLARAFANPRVRQEFKDSQAWFLDQTSESFKEFERRVADWVSLADADGPEPRPEPAHENRDVTLVQDHFSKAWTLRGSFGSVQGSAIKRVLDAYLEAETLTDWDQARDAFGEAACRDDLNRTDGQRRADAFAQIVADAADNPNESLALDTCHNIVWSQGSFEAALARYCGAPPEPVEPDDHHCADLDGNRLDPDTAFADLLLSRWRRVVVSAAGVTLDMSRSQRFYKGLARLGVQINATACFWPGCDVPISRCQVDHRRPAARGGQTTQSNGSPCCQRHNRLKERGYVVTRLPDGSIQVKTPSGEVIPR